MTKEYLGFLFWYSLSRMEIEDIVLEELCEKSGLVYQELFFPISRENVYKNQTKAFGYKETRDDGDYVYMVDTTTPEGKRASGKKRYLKEWHKRDELSDPEVRFLGYWDFIEDELAPVNTSGDPMFDDLTHNLALRIGEYEHLYTDKHLRDALRRLLWFMEAIPYRPSGGLYFAPPSYESTLEALSKLFPELTRHEKEEGMGTEFEYMPVVKTSHQGEILARKLIDYITKEAKVLQQKISDKIAVAEENGHKVAKSTYKKAARRRDELLEREEAYSKLLGKDFKPLKPVFEALETDLQEMYSYTDGGG